MRIMSGGFLVRGRGMIIFQRYFLFLDSSLSTLRNSIIASVKSSLLPAQLSSFHAHNRSL